MVIAALSAIASPAAAAPSAGGRYDGRVKGSPERAILKVANNRAGLTSYFLSARIPCSDGKSRTFGFNQEKEPPAKFTGDAFTLTSRTESRFRYEQKGADPVGSLNIAVAGTFGTDTVSGTVTPTFTSKTARCSASVPFTMALDGTAGAPFRDAVMATGEYRVTHTDGISVAPFSTIAPGRLLNGLTIRWESDCGPGTFNGRFPFVPLQLTSGGRFAVVKALDAGRAKGKKGVRYATSANLSLRFSKQGSAYRVRGAWRATTVLTRGKKKLATCRSKRLVFNGRLRSGPR
jgi:hypothetical protein